MGYDEKSEYGQDSQLRGSRYDESYYSSNQGTQHTGSRYAGSLYSSNQGTQLSGSQNDETMHSISEDQSGYDQTPYSNDISTAPSEGQSMNHQTFYSMEANRNSAEPTTSRFKL